MQPAMKLNRVRPSIVPYKLLYCLRALLNENGGILRHTELQRFVDLMRKYCKKLVAKCIYVQILKATNLEWLEEFMGIGGWDLVRTWLSKSIRVSCWPFVQEVLELLLLCSVQAVFYRCSSALIAMRMLSKDAGTEPVKLLAQQWLQKRQGSQQLQLLPTTASTAAIADKPAVDMSALQQESLNMAAPQKEVHKDQTINNVACDSMPKVDTKSITQVDVNDNWQMVNAVDTAVAVEMPKDSAIDADELVAKIHSAAKRIKQELQANNVLPSSACSVSSYYPRAKITTMESSLSSNQCESIKGHGKSSCSISCQDKNKDKKCAADNSDASSAPDKQKKQELANNKALLSPTMLATPLASIVIPTKKRSTISIEKGRGNVKTVKTYNSQFRSHGLTEAAPPPPSRKTLQRPPSATIVSAAPSLSSISNTYVSARAKIEQTYASQIIERPGAIKVIPLPTNATTLAEANVRSAANKSKKRKRSLKNEPIENSTTTMASTDVLNVPAMGFYRELNAEYPLDDSIDSFDSSTKENDIATYKSYKLKKKGKEGHLKELKHNKHKPDEALQPAFNSVCQEKSGGPVLQAKKPKEEQKVLQAKNEDESVYVEIDFDDDDIDFITNILKRQMQEKKNEEKTSPKLVQDSTEESAWEMSAPIEATDTQTAAQSHDHTNKTVSALKRVQFASDAFLNKPYGPLIEVANVPSLPMGEASTEYLVQHQREQTTLPFYNVSGEMMPDSPAELEPELELLFQRRVKIIPTTANDQKVYDLTKTPYPLPKDFQCVTNDALHTMNTTNDKTVEPNMFAQNSIPVIDRDYRNPMMFSNAFTPSNYQSYGNNMPIPFMSAYNHPFMSAYNHPFMSAYNHPFQTSSFVPSHETHSVSSFTSEPNFSSSFGSGATKNNRSMFRKSRFDRNRYERNKKRSQY